MPAYVARAGALRDVHVKTLAVEVADEQFIAVFGRPAFAEVGHHAGMRVAAARGIAAGVARVRAALTGPVDMIAVLFDIVVNVRVNGFAAALPIAARLPGVDGEMLAALPLQARALNHVPEVRDHAHLREELSVLVEVDAPRIAAAFGEDLEDVARRMVTPHARIHPLTLLGGRAGPAHVRRTKHPVTAVEPAVRPPGEGVERLVRVGREVPAIEQNPRIARRLRVIPILHRHEH